MSSVLKIRLTYPPAMREGMAYLTRRIEDRTDHHKAVASGMESLIRGHVLDAAASRHTTARSLGARPTGYLTKMARGVEAVWNKSWASVQFPTGDSRGIFARVDGPVTITPRSGKYLTIPAIAASYGKRAREFADLKYVQFGRGPEAPKALAKKDGNGKLKVYFWLKESVTLPQDEGLLPTDSQISERMAESTADWIDYQLLELPE